MRKMEEKLLEEQQKTNQLLEQLIKQNKDPNELLTVEQIKEETGIGINMVRKMFKDPKLQVQVYTVPFKVTRQAFNNYISERHDYLSER
jgi:S-adenosylhomocysteine hydrolase